MNAERRRHPRMRTNLLVQLLSAGGEYRVDYATDLSQGGLFIRTDHPLPVGERFSLQLPTGGDGTMVEARCRVARVSAEGMGAEFLSFESLSPLRC